MTIHGEKSGIAITIVRVSNFRFLSNIELELNDLTVLIGANNAGKTSFLDAMFAAIGAGRKALGADDVRLEPTEAIAGRRHRADIFCLLMHAKYDAARKWHESWDFEPSPTGPYHLFLLLKHLLWALR